MLRTDEILSTIHMLHAEHLDVRSVTLALNLEDCAGPSIEHMCRKVRQKIASRASRLVEICDRVGAKYGIPVINKRLAISPAATLLAGHGVTAAVQLAMTLDAAAVDCCVDFVGGFTALVQKGVTAGDDVVIRSLPEVLSKTRRVCASVNVASRKAGINMDAVGEMGRVLLRIAEATAPHAASAARSWWSSPTFPRTTRSWPGPTWARASRKRPSISAFPGRAWSAAPCGAALTSANGSAWATWPRRSKSPASASRASAN